MFSQMLRLRPGASVCRCVSCISKSAVAGATSTLPTKAAGRHTLLFYSSIISTAATADVFVKRNRKKEWDKKIDELEQSLRSTDAGLDETEDSAIAPVEEWGSREYLQHRPQHLQPPNLSIKDHRLEALRGMEKPRDETRAPAIALMEQSHTWANERAHPQHIQPLGMANRTDELEALRDMILENDRSATRQIRANRSFTSIASIYTSDRRKANKREWSPKKELTIEYAMAKLAARVMLLSPLTSDSKWSTLERVREDMQANLETIKDIDPHSTRHLERPSFPQYDIASQTIEEGTHPLNRAVFKCLQRCSEGVYTVEQMLSKVAYNLLVSQVAPDTRTFSMLVSRLSKLGCAMETDMVIEALEETHLRHDEISVNTILCHYRRHNDPTNFHRYVLKIQGYHGALQLAHPDTDLSSTTSRRLRQWGDKILESVDLTPRLYNTIVSGYDKFGLVTSRKEWSNATADANFTLNLPMLLSSLASCIRRFSWQHGWGIWHQIKDRMSDVHQQHELRPCDTRGAYHLMLKLCLRCSQPEWFRTIYAEALGQGIRLDELFLNREADFLPAKRRDHAAKHLRSASILLHRLHLLTADVRELQVWQLAHKLLQADRPLGQIKQHIVDHGPQALLERWLEDRPWLVAAAQSSRNDLVVAINDAFQSKRPRKPRLRPWQREPQLPGYSRRPSGFLGRQSLAAQAQAHSHTQTELPPSIDSDTSRDQRKDGIKLYPETLPNAQIHPASVGDHEQTDSPPSINRGWARQRETYDIKPESEFHNNEPQKERRKVPRHYEGSQFDDRTPFERALAV